MQRRKCIQIYKGEKKTVESLGHLICTFEAMSKKFPVQYMKYSEPTVDLTEMC